MEKSLVFLCSLLWMLVSIVLSQMASSLQQALRELEDLKTRMDKAQKDVLECNRRLQVMERQDEEEDNFVLSVVKQLSAPSPCRCVAQTEKAAAPAKSDAEQRKKNVGEAGRTTSSTVSNHVIDREMSDTRSIISPDSFTHVVLLSRDEAQIRETRCCRTTREVSVLVRATHVSI